MSKEIDECLKERCIELWYVVFRRAMVHVQSTIAVLFSMEMHTFFLLFYKFLSIFYAKIYRGTVVQKLLVVGVFENFF